MLIRCAALRAELGVRIAQAAGQSGRTIILERRESYSNDRTWCFWRGTAHPFEHLIAHFWRKMRVQSRPAQVVVDCGAMPYQLLSAGTFYQYAEEKIAASPNVELRLGAAVREEPVRIAGGWTVETERGAVRARQILDTRPPRHVSAGDALLWQSFVDYEIACVIPVFDPSMVELVDFETPHDDGIAFTYVLPTSPNRALVEYTVFGRRPRSVASLAGTQRAAVVRASRGNPVVVIREESGVLPMGLTLDHPPPQVGYARVGLLSGAGRASTGYAFQRIQRWADSMFRGADASRVIRFLSDRGTAIDCAAIIATLPVGLFLW